MDQTEFSFLPKRKQEYCEKYAGPFPVSAQMNVKYAWCRSVENLLARQSMRERVNGEAAQADNPPVFADVYDDLAGPIDRSKPQGKKSVSEILKKAS